MLASIHWGSYTLGMIKRHTGSIRRISPEEFTDIVRTGFDFFKMDNVTNRHARVITELAKIPELDQESLGDAIRAERSLVLSAKEAYNLTLVRAAIGFKALVCNKADAGLLPVIKSIAGKQAVDTLGSLVGFSVEAVTHIHDGVESKRTLIVNEKPMSIPAIIQQETNLVDPPDVEQHALNGLYVVSQFVAFRMQMVNKRSRPMRYPRS